MTEPKVWDRHEILSSLRRAGMTLGGIAEEYGVPHSSVKNIWTRPNEPVERAIADFLGVPVERLWAWDKRYPKKRNRIYDPNRLRSSHSKTSPSRQDAA